MKTKKIGVRVYTHVLTLGLNNQAIVIDDEHWYAKDYFKLVCPYYVGCQYTGDKRFTITYEDKHG